MSTNTKIEWTDHTFNPWIGCTKVGPGCDNCYAKADFEDRRHRVTWGAGQPRSRTQTWGDPVRWNKQEYWLCEECGHRGTDKELALTKGNPCHHEMRMPVRQRVFCASLSDVFDNEVNPQWRSDLFSLIEATPNLDWLLLTKRIGNVYSMVPLRWLGSPLRGKNGAVVHHAGWPDHVWLGATICTQDEADRDIPKLLKVPSAKRFLSMEPLLGPVDLKLMARAYGFPKHIAHDGNCVGMPQGLHHVIVGGESGPNARPMHPDWARSLRDQCQAAGVPFFFKQWGEWKEPLKGEEFDTSMGRAAKPPAFILSETGTVHCFESPHIVNGKAVIKVGKKSAGRLLDGREWNGVPS